jgi:hypothetical protein
MSRKIDRIKINIPVLYSATMCFFQGTMCFVLEPCLDSRMLKTMIVAMKTPKNKSWRTTPIFMILCPLLAVVSFASIAPPVIVSKSFAQGPR